MLILNGTSETERKEKSDIASCIVMKIGMNLFFIKSFLLINNLISLKIKIINLLCIQALVQIFSFSNSKNYILISKYITN